MLVNEHPRESICCTVSLPQDKCLCGTRLDLLNSTKPVAFDGVLELAPYESCVVVLEASGAIEPADCTDTSTRATLALDISHSWTVALSPAGSDGTFGEPQKLERLCDLTAEQFPGVCGTFRYRTSFELADDLAHTVIDLGDVYEVATLTLDGQTLGTRIWPALPLCDARLPPAHTSSPSMSSTRSTIRPPTSSPSPSPSRPAVSSAPLPFSGKTCQNKPVSFWQVWRVREFEWISNARLPRRRA